MRRFLIVFSLLFAANSLYADDPFDDADVFGDNVNDTSGVTVPRDITFSEVWDQIEIWQGGGIALAQADLIDNTLFQQANATCGVVIDAWTFGQGWAVVSTDWILDPEVGGYSGPTINKSFVTLDRDATVAGILTWYPNILRIGAFTVQDWGGWNEIYHDSSWTPVLFEVTPWWTGTYVYYLEQDQQLTHVHDFNIQEYVLIGSFAQPGIASAIYHIDVEAEAPMPGSEIRDRIYTTSAGLTWEALDTSDPPN